MNLFHDWTKSEGKWRLTINTRFADQDLEQFEAYSSWYPSKSECIDEMIEYYEVFKESKRERNILFYLKKRVR